MRSRWTAVALLAAAWAFSLWAVPRLPAEVPVHWNLQGEVDRWGSRGMAAFLAPAIVTGVVALLAVLPRVDPRRENHARFADETARIAILIAAFLLFLQVVTLGVALGWPLRAPSLIVAGVGALLAVMGNYLPRIRSNWWIGIRTPWTLSSDRVWRETHRVGGRTFVAGGALMAASAFLPARWQPWVTLPAVALAAGVPFVYSYVAWRREQAGR